MNHTDTVHPETAPEEVDEFDIETIDPETKVFNLSDEELIFVK